MINVFSLALLILFPAFQKQSTTKHPLVLFERVFVNQKDAFQVRGETIDCYGRIHSFNNRNDKPGVKYREWNLGKRDFQPFSWEMMPGEVEKNLSMTDSVTGVIHPDTLSKYMRLLNLIAESNKNFESTLVVSSTSNVSMKPNYSTTTYGFLYDAKRNIYKRIRIEYHTGVEWQNQSEHVSEIMEWKW